MKKIIALTACTASLSAYALPTYEPFTEYAPNIQATGSNAIDLCTAGVFAPGGEKWGSLNFSGTFGTNIAGLDILVTNKAGLFTATALGSLLPATFPGFPASGQSITNVLMNPAQPLVSGAVSPNIIGNSAILIFSQDVTRPASGTRTVYVSYLWSLAQVGQLGAANDARYMNFVAASNTVEGKGTSGFYQTWQPMLDSLPGTCVYAANGVITDGSGAFYNIACDSSTGKEFTTSSFNSPYNSVQFIVTAYTFSAAGTDTNLMWVNPSLAGLGGATPPASPITSYAMPKNMSDIGGLVIDDRPGKGAANGGIGSNYMANLLIGSTWSYVTGGPEFTNQPGTATANYGGTFSLSAAATAAGQSVSYQWQHVSGGVTNNVTTGAGGAGGAGTVAISTSGNISTLQLTGVSPADFGNYQCVATASGTGYVLTSSQGTATPDPLITTPPQNASTALGGSAVFNIGATTQFGSLTYQWQMNGTALANGTRGDGSLISGATTSSLTIANFQLDENNASITCAVTNGLPAGEISPAATLTLSDPAITSEPQSVTTNQGGVVKLSATIQTAHAPLTYAWYNGSTILSSGTLPDGTIVSGATGTINTSGTSTSTLTLSGVSYQDNGTYTLMVTNASASTVTSTPAVLYVNDPYVSVQPPAVVEVPVGGTVTIPATAGGTGATYEWYQNGNSLANQNTGDATGFTTRTLTISSAQASDDGTYYLTVSGGTNASPGLQSANAVVYVENAPGSVSVTPSTLTQQAGTHLAFVGNFTGGDPYVHAQWTRNNVALANGVQPDGSTLIGASVTLSGTNTTTLVMNNIQTGDSGTYALIISNAAGNVSASASLTVSSGLLPLSTNNIVVSRVGEGSQALSASTGNTLYLDQFTTNGGYVSSIMVPDSGPNQLIVTGAGTEGQNESYMTLSGNQYYLNFAGYYHSYPYGGPGNVTLGQQNSGGSTTDIRSIGAVNGLGYYQLAYTNYGLYSGGGAFIRDAFSTDGLTNFWTTGAAGSGAVKYVQAGPGGASYASGSGVPAMGGAGIVNGPISLGLAGTNLVFSDNTYPGYSDTNVFPGQSGSSVPYYSAGLDAFSGTPTPLPVGTVANQTNLVYAGASCDFAFSPDLNTLYIADSSPSPSAGGGGGVQRWDLINGVYAYQYVLVDTTSPTGTNGVRGLAVYFPPNITTWGQGVTGAALYATTAEASTNRLIEFVDQGSGSTATLLTTAGPNQFLRGVRFGPAKQPVSIVAAPQAVTTYVGQSATLNVTAGGDAPYSYQWQFDGTNISGATDSSLTLTNLQASQTGTYTVVVSDPASTNSSSAVVTVSTGPATLVLPPQPYTGTVGDHFSLSATVGGTQPITYQWYSNSVLIPGATASAYGLTNATTSDSGTYSVTFGNQFSTNSTSAVVKITAGYQPLSSQNLVLLRIGDGAESLSRTTGNTVYLDQVTPAGAYSNTIMIPDNDATTDLILPGGLPESAQDGALTMSANNVFLNFGGFEQSYPAFSFNTSAGVYRAIAAVNAFGYYQVEQDNQTLYNANANELFRSAVSKDGYAEFWTTGFGTSGGGLKYTTSATGANLAPGGSANSTMVAGIVAGNIAYSDASQTPAGIYAFSGFPTSNALPSLNLVADAAGNPQDFSASPDTTYPPSTSTVYLCDTSATGSGGGVQRYDWNGTAYALSYTLGTGTGSTNGASCLVVDYSAHATWGSGVTGAIIYATTTAGASNQLIKIVDNGAASGAAVLAQANANEILRGVRFGPAQAAPFVTASASHSTFVGSSSVFTANAQNGPIVSYQWNLNGVPLTNGPSSSGSGAIISGAQTANLTISPIGAADDQGNYTVTVSSPFPTPTTSAPVIQSVPARIVTPTATAQEFATNGGSATFTVTATGGAPLTYQWTSPCGVLSDGPGGDPCNGGAVVAGSSTASLTVSGVSSSDAGSYSVTVSNPDPSATNNTATPFVLTVISSAPQFSPITGVGSSPQLNFTGAANTAYTVWATTNVALTPVTSKWTKLTTGTFDGNGNATYTLTPPAVQRYYMITQP